MKNLMIENEVTTEEKNRYLHGDLDALKYMEILRPEHLANLAGHTILWAAPVDHRQMGYYWYGIDGGIAHYDGFDFLAFEGADLNKAKVMDGSYCLGDFERFVHFQVVG